MAKAMNGSGNEQLAQALRDAEQEGELCAPTKLISLVSGREQPPDALPDFDQANQLFDAFHQEFGFIRWSFLSSSWPPNAAFAQPMDLPRYASLLRWLIKELRNWRLENDPKFQKLTSVLVAAQVCDLGGAF